jgi:transcriptional regulator with XRE-family HTH domain
MSLNSDQSTDYDQQLRVLADEIRHFRKRRQFSLEKLAEVSGVSRSMISKIERCESAPSTVVLAKIAEALGVTFSQLMAPAMDREAIHIPAARQPILRDEETGFLRRCISPVLPGRGIDWVLNTLPVGASTGAFVAHRRGVEEYIWIMRGKLRAEIGDEKFLMSEGDSLYFHADVSHAFVNVGKGECQYFLIINSAKPR